MDSEQIDLCAFYKAVILTFSRFLLGKIESYVRLVRSKQDAPEQMQTYVSRAMTQWSKHLQRYQKWEASGEKNKPTIVDVD